LRLHIIIYIQFSKKNIVYILSEGESQVISFFYGPVIMEVVFSPDV